MMFTLSNKKQHIIFLADVTRPLDIIFKSGDRVSVDVNLDTFKPLVDAFGGWLPEFEKVSTEKFKIILL